MKTPKKNICPYCGIDENVFVKIKKELFNYRVKSTFVDAEILIYKDTYRKLCGAIKLGFSEKELLKILKEVEDL